MEKICYILSDTPNLSLVSLSRSGFPAHPRLVLPHTDSSSYFYRSYLDKVLMDKTYIFKCQRPLGLKKGMICNSVFLLVVSLDPFFTERDVP